MDYSSYASEFLAIALAYGVIVVSPGPNFVMTVRNSLTYSRRAGFLTACGISLGKAFHASYTLIGIGFLIKNSPWGFTVMKVLGASYLVYIGWRSIFKPKPAVSRDFTENACEGLSPFQALRCGFLTDALNPLSLMFFLTFFTLTIDAKTPKAVKLLYGFEVVAIAFFWFTFIALCFSNARLQSWFRKSELWVGRLTGGVLISLACRLAFAVPN